MQLQERRREIYSQSEALAFVQPRAGSLREQVFKTSKVCVDFDVRTAIDGLGCQELFLVEDKGETRTSGKCGADFVHVLKS
jgi:hypothetical protein